MFYETVGSCYYKQMHLV